MRRLVVVAFLVLAAAVAYRSLGGEETGTGDLTLPPPEPNEGQNARPFAVRDVEGGSFTLSEEGVYVLAFWSMLNRDSGEERTKVEDLAREYADEDVSFAAVYVNGAPADSGAPYTTVEDKAGRLSSRYNAKRVPRLFLIKDGEIRFVLDGYYEGSGEEIEKALRIALKQGS